MSIQIKENIKLDTYTTLQIGGVARYLVAVESVADLAEARFFAIENNLPVFFLGGGSNVLIADEGFEGLVILNKMLGVTFLDETEETVIMACASAEVWDEVVALAVSKNYYGLENLSSIPGTVGGAPVQNVGAYGTDMSEIVTKVEAMDFRSGEVKIFSNKECDFGYRTSFFKTEIGKSFFIISVNFQLQKNFSLNLNYPDLKNKFVAEEPTLKKVRAAVIEVRANKFPNWREVGTAGSFFKNPVIEKAAAEILQEKFPEMPQYLVSDTMVKIPLGYILDKVCDLKGWREGNVGLYEKQALVLVNYGGATFSEVENFASEVAKKVFEKTKIEIFSEVNFIKSNFLKK